MALQRQIANAALLVVMGVGPAFAQSTHLLGSAHTVLLQSDVIFNKNRKAYPVPSISIYRTGLLKYFREVRSNPDIIIKIHKDVFLLEEEKISLTVFNADDNSVIYSEERKLVDEENDVNRLIAHFLVRVTEERDVVAGAAAERKQAEIEAVKKHVAVGDAKDLKALSEAKVVVTFYSSSDSLMQAMLQANRNNPNEYHVYLDAASSRDEADVVLEEKRERGICTLTLETRDTGEILHTETATDKSTRRAVFLMSKWITSTSWE